MSVFDDFLNNFGTSAEKQSQVSEASNQKKAQLSGDDYYKMAATVGRPDLVPGLTGEQQALVEMNPLVRDAYLSGTGSSTGEYIRGVTSGLSSYSDDVTATRNNAEAYGDWATGIGQGAANLVTGTAALGGGLVDLGLGTNIGGAISDFSDGMNNVINENLKSDALAARQRALKARTDLLQVINDNKYAEDVANGEGISADFARIGRGFVDSFTETGSDGAALSDVVAQGIGSMIPIGKMSQGAQLAFNAFKSLPQKEAIAAAKATLKNKAATAAERQAAREILQPSNWAGATVIGGTTAGGAYTQAYSDAMREMKDRTDLSEPEKQDLANKAAMTAAAITFPGAIAAGRVVAPFEMNLLGKASAGKALSRAPAEFMEEGIQGGTETASGNYGIQQFVNPDREVSKGVGEAAGTESLGGLGSAGIISLPGAAVGTVKDLATVKANKDKERVVRRADRVIQESVSPGSDKGLNKVLNSVQNNSADTEPERQEKVRVVEDIQQSLNNATGTKEKITEGYHHYDDETKNKLVEELNRNGDSTSAQLKGLLDIVSNDENLNEPIGQLAAEHLYSVIGEYRNAMMRVKEAISNNAEIEFSAEEKERFALIHKALEELTGKPDTQNKLTTLRDKLVNKLKDGGYDNDPINAFTVATAVLTEPGNLTADDVKAIRSKYDEAVKTLQNQQASPSAPLSSKTSTSVAERAQRASKALELFESSLRTLEDNLGKNTLSEKSEKVKANVAAETDLQNKYTSLKDHAARLTSAYIAGKDIKGNLEKLAKFAQGQLNKAAALKFSQEQGKNNNGFSPKVAVSTYSQKRGQFDTDTVSPHFALSSEYRGDKNDTVAFQKWNNSKVYQDGVAREASAAAGLFDVFNKALEDAGLPSLVPEGGEWSAEGTKKLTFQSNNKNGRALQYKMVVSDEAGEVVTATTTADESIETTTTTTDTNTTDSSTAPPPPTTKTKTKTKSKEKKTPPKKDTEDNQIPLDLVVEPDNTPVAKTMEQVISDFKTGSSTKTKLKEELAKASKEDLRSHLRNSTNEGKGKDSEVTQAIRETLNSTKEELLSDEAFFTACPEPTLTGTVGNVEATAKNIAEQMLALAQSENISNDVLAIITIMRTSLNNIREGSDSLANARKVREQVYKTIEENDPKLWEVLKEYAKRDIERIRTQHFMEGSFTNLTYGDENLFRQAHLYSLLLDAKNTGKTTEQIKPFSDAIRNGKYVYQPTDNKGKGSEYITSDLGTVYETVYKELLTGKKYAQAILNVLGKGISRKLKEGSFSLNIGYHVYSAATGIGEKDGKYRGFLNLNSSGQLTGKSFGILNGGLGTFLHEVVHAVTVDNADSKYNEDMTNILKVARKAHERNKENIDPVLLDSINYALTDIHELSAVIMEKPAVAAYFYGLSLEEDEKAAINDIGDYSSILDAIKGTFSKILERLFGTDADNAKSITEMVIGSVDALHERQGFGDTKVKKPFTLILKKGGKGSTYLKLDQRKATLATHFIGANSPGSKNTDYIANANEAGIPVNENTYTSDDVVFVSVLPGSFDAIKQYVDAAIKAGATIVAEGVATRGKDFHKNGEGLLADYLAEKANNYEDTSIGTRTDKDAPGIWKPKAIDTDAAFVETNTDGTPKQITSSEYLNRALSTIGNGHATLINKFKDMLKLSTGNQAVLQTIAENKVEDALRAAYIEARDKFDEDKPIKSFDDTFKEVRSAIEARFKLNAKYHLNEATIGRYLNNGALGFKDKEFANFWVNAQGTVDKALLDAMALVSVLWVHSPNSTTGFDSSFLAEMINQNRIANHMRSEDSVKYGNRPITREEVAQYRKETGLKYGPKLISKDDVSDNAKSFMRNNAMSPVDATTKLSSMLNSVLGIKGMDSDKARIYDEGVLSVLGSIMLTSMMDKGIVLRQPVTIDKWGNFRLPKSLGDVRFTKPVTQEDAKRLSTEGFTALNEYTIDTNISNQMMGIYVNDNVKTNGRAAASLDKAFPGSFEEKLFYTSEESPPVDNVLIRSRTRISKALSQVLNIANNIVYEVIPHVASIYSNMDEKDFIEVFGTGMFRESFRKEAVNTKHALSLEGKTVSAKTDYDAAMLYISEAQGQPEGWGYKFKHQFSKVLRLQQQGGVGMSTPQGSKVIRGLMTPGKSTLDFSLSEDVEMFKRAVAQHLGIKVAEDLNWETALDEKTNSSEFKNALAAVKKLQEHENDGLGSKAALTLEDRVALHKVLSDEGAHAILAIAEWETFQNALNNKGSKKATVYLTIEADGKTNGPASIIYSMTTSFNKSWIQNLKRIGVSLGSKDTKTLADIFNDTGEDSIKGADFYRIVGNNLSEQLSRYLTRLRSYVTDAVMDNVHQKYKRNIQDKFGSKRLNAGINTLLLERVDVFPAFKVAKPIPTIDGTPEFRNKDLYSDKQKIGVLDALTKPLGGLISYDESKGTISIGRNLVKNPITVTLYGAGAAGIADKITEAIADVFAEKITEALQSNDSVKLHSVTDGINSFLEQIEDNSYKDNVTLDGSRSVLSFVKLPKLEKTKTALQEYQLGGAAFEGVSKVILDNFVQPLVQEIANAVGDSANKATKLSIASTNISYLYAKATFDAKLKKLAEDKKAEILRNDPKLKREDLDKLPLETLLTRSELDNLYAETIGQNPPIELDTGTISLGTSERATTLIEVSGLRASEGSGMVRQHVNAGINTFNMVSPSVGIAPYSAIASGDASTVVKTMQTKEDFVYQTQYIFDGYMVALKKAREANKHINAANIDAWNKNPMRPIADAFRNVSGSGSVINTLSPEERGTFLKEVVRLYEAAFNGATFSIKGLEKEGLSQAQILGLITYDIQASLDLYTKRIDAKYEVLKAIGISSDQFSATNSPSYTQEDPAMAFDKATQEHIDYIKNNIENITSEDLAYHIDKAVTYRVTQQDNVGYSGSLGSDANAKNYLDNALKDKSLPTHIRRAILFLQKHVASNPKLLEDIRIATSKDKEKLYAGADFITVDDASPYTKNNVATVLSHSMKMIAMKQFNDFLLRDPRSPVNTLQDKLAHKGFERFFSLAQSMDKLKTLPEVSDTQFASVKRLLGTMAEELGIQDLDSTNFSTVFSNLLEEARNTEPGKQGIRKEAALKLSKAMATVLEASYTDLHLRNLLESRTSNSSIKEIVKGLRTKKKELVSAAKENPFLSFLNISNVINEIKNMISIVKDIFNYVMGERLATAMFSIGADVQASYLLFSGFDPENRGTAPNPTPKTRKPKGQGTSGSNKKGNPQAPASSSKFGTGTVGSLAGDPELINLVRKVRNLLPELDSIGRAEALDKILFHIPKMNAKIQSYLNTYGGFSSIEKNRIARDIVTYVTIKNLRPEVAMKIQEIYTATLDKLLDSSLPNDKKNALLKLSSVRFEGIKGDSFGAAIFASLVQYDKELRDFVDSEVTTEVTQEGSIINRSLFKLGESMKDLLNDYVSYGSYKKLSNSQELALLMDNAVKADSEETILETLGGKSNSIVDRIDERTSDAIDSTFTKLAKNTSGKLGAVFNTMTREGREKLLEDIIDINNREGVYGAIRSSIVDTFGHDNYLHALTALNKKTKNVFQSIRQGVRNRVPLNIGEKFSRKLDQEEWKALTDVLGKLDLSSLGVTTALSVLESKTKLAETIKSFEDDLSKDTHWGEVKADAKKLARYLATGVIEPDLKMNALAVSELRNNGSITERDRDYVQRVDGLISLYALEMADLDSVSLVQELARSESEGISYALGYHIGLINAEIGSRTSSTKYNARKGYLPQTLEEGSAIRIAHEREADSLLERGYIQGESYRGSNEPGYYYYFNPSSGLGAFSQGISQNIRETDRGIDSHTGLPLGIINGGLILNEQELRRVAATRNTSPSKEGLIPLRNSKGKVIGYERAVDLTKVSDAVFETNYAKMLGIIAGRQYEEYGSSVINTELVHSTFKGWERALIEGKQNQYINILDSTKLTKVQRDAINLIPKNLKYEAQELFGNGVWMVRRDSIDIAFGYRKPGVGDFISGISNWDAETQTNVRKAIESMFGKKAFHYLIKSEKFVQGAATEAKVIIVVKSVIVPMFNTFYNIVQLMNNGVPITFIAKQIPRILNESILLSKSLEEETKLRADLISYQATGSDQIIVAGEKMRALLEARKKLAIYPLYERGEFGSVQDVGDAADLRSLASGDFANVIEEKVNQLPAIPKDVVKNLYMTKDSPIFQFLQKSVEYGDFVSKAILYEYETSKLTSTGTKRKMEMDAIFRKVKEEFVDYDLPPGRNRAYLESMGMLWFWNYKLRTTKAAIRLFFEHPFRTLLYSFGSTADTPFKENIFAKALQGTLPASMGLGFLGRSAEIHGTASLASHLL